MTQSFTRLCAPVVQRNVSNLLATMSDGDIFNVDKVDMAHQSSVDSSVDRA